MKTIEYTQSGEATSGGIGLCGLLGIVFIVLKLTGQVAWSWWVVLAPIYVPFIIAAAAATLFLWLALRR